MIRFPACSPNYKPAIEIYEKTRASIQDRILCDVSNHYNELLLRCQLKSVEADSHENTDAKLNS